MKVRAYIRIAKASSGKPKIVATLKPSDEPIKESYGNALPTVAFAVEFDVPDATFRRSQQLIATVEISDAQPLATVRQIESAS